MSLTDPKRGELIAGLLAGKTLKDAASTAEVPYATARRWAGDAAFTAELAAARRLVIGEALDVLTAGARAAAAEVLRIMHDKTVAPYVQLRAAQTLLERLHKWIELEDLDARLKALEAKNEPSDT